MFSWLFGSNDTEDDVINNIFYYTIHNNNTMVIKLLDDHKNIDLNDKRCKDKYNNTLLHILANSQNATLVRHLIIQGLRRDHVNVFGEKAINIALKNNNLTMVRVLSDIEQDPELIQRIEGLEVQRKTLYERIEKTETALGTANEEIKTLKRKRCDQCDVNVRENKRLKAENDVLGKTNEKLTKDNSDLQTTVTNLRATFKK
ncbi:hypothetical protein Klosneuvirus_3_185 [Klosneuvirus KNV1]|uniref:Uncharacterized protein n=1 Tax=Klosneuvirus KNV1 TaxID=1977640 RepID=A0A1V0SJZ4_9VIRU|nr:hypothetical protein Klosneuvirus_3_185 [Klosneuvirus KNV1]